MVATGLALPALSALAAVPALAAPADHGIDYDIVYVRQPRFGDLDNSLWPEVFHPARADPGADLMLLHPDGSQELLVAGGVGSVTDPVLSLDGEWVYYSLFHDLSPGALNFQRDDLPYLGADIFRIRLSDRHVEQLTFGEFTPNTGAGHWDESNPLDPPPQFNRLGYGILNLGPMPLPGGKIAFTSNRNAFEPPKGFTAPTLQLFVMDHDGSNVEPVAPMTISSALHPTVLRDGRLMFSTHESQGLRDRRLWGIWTIRPDGTGWAPLISAFRSPQAFHFMTQLSSGDLVVVDYYNLNNNGFGSLYRMPLDPPPGEPRFHSAFPADNPPIQQTVGGGFLYPFKMPFTPRGLHSITPFTHGNDEAAPVGGDGSTRVGKLTHPSAAPGDDLLVVWSPGPANDLNRPTPLPYYDAGLYLMPGAQPIWDPGELLELVNDPAYNEAWPRAVLPYSAIHGVVEPQRLPWLPGDGTLHPALPAGTAHGLVGSSSLYKRESFPGHVTSWANSFDGLDAFNTSENGQSSNWGTQGAEAGLYSDSDIWAVRVVAMEPNTHRSYGPNSGRRFDSHANERLRILGEVAVRKTDGGGPLLDPEGNPDTSFLVKIPADTPFTFQTLDRRGLVLNASQTWHQVRPGEVRVDCGGCHAHSQQPLAFEQTAAGQPGFPAVDLAATTPLLSADAQGNPITVELAQPVFDVEFLRHIRPLLQRSCVSCHTQDDPSPPGNLVLDDLAEIDGLPGDYYRLAADTGADFGHPPVIANGTWRQTNRSRYVRAFQSRRSLLIWKIFGERLDGWSNADHPTESVPGDASTLPAGTDANDADLDFTGTRMPPPGSGATPLSADEQRLFARWIDLGAPVDLDGPQTEYGWMLDDLRPALHLDAPRGGWNPQPVSAIRYGVADANSGIDPTSVSVAASFEVAGRPPGAELADLALHLGDGVFEIDLGAPLGDVSDETVTVEVADLQGNVTRVHRHFSTVPDSFDGVVFRDGFEGGDTAAWSASVGG
ncbi:MAG: hypothetical protein DWQ36_09405 [Acidobacteria bacterium]|nr:MAG: hypothetical protein DWQ30_22650 [Acidobacteriota bacterium]REK08573.1 MAG: hypothetical protein DWQ36_09405 [Acidobacteriota bacterium]